jgi:acetyl-CoA carboxylase biotin carboxyl carrier protein|tara:strand:+ start:425 stop:919 length:495 start_codon:yes stop_codon:yes gene_type:complete
MDLNDIQELIKFVAKSGATEVDLEIDNIKISIKSPAKKRRGTQDEAPMLIHQDLTQAPATITPLSQTIVNTTTDNNEGVEEKTDHLLTVKSSMIGTFYRGSSPETPPFISVGDEINIGDTICIIEAMKLFNEIESEISGEIVKILVDDSTPIEFDQPLFLVDPS